MILAIQAYGKTHRFIQQHKLWKWILLPGTICTALVLLNIYYLWGFTGSMTDYLFDVAGIRNWIQELESGWISFFFLLLALGVRLLFSFFYLSLLKYFFLAIGAPLFAVLSEKTACLLQSRAFSLSWPWLLQEMKRGGRVVGRNMLHQTLTLLLLLVLSFLPVIGWVTPLIAFFVECYFFGFSMMDYGCARYFSYGSRQSIVFTTAHRGLAIGNGMAFYAMLFIPLLGWMLAPSYAVLSATLNIHQSKLS